MNRGLRFPVAGWSFALRGRIRFLATAICFGSLAATLPAANWSTAVSGNWDDASKWNTLPANGQDANLYVDGSYTATINNATVDLSPGTVTNLNDIGVGNGAGDNQTLLVNFTNSSRNVRSRIVRILYGGAPTLRIEQGTLEVYRRLNLGYVTAGTGTVRIVGGMLTATQAVANGDWSTVGGNDTVGTGFIDQQGGRVLFDRVAIGYYSGSVGLWNLSGGTGSVSHTFVVGQNLGSTGNVIVAGGGLKDTTSLGVQIGVNGSGTVIVSNGLFETTGMTLGYSGGLGNRFQADGGTTTVSGLITVGRVNGSGGILCINGGVLNVTNTGGSVDVSYQALVPSDARLIVSNGTLNAMQVSIGGDAGSYGKGAGTMRLAGGVVSVWSNFYAGAKKNGSTGVVEIVDSGILEFKGLAFTVGQSGATGGRGFVTNQNGGTIRFVALNNPSITVNAGSSLVTSNAVIEFKGAANANLAGTIATAITYGGTNMLSLNAATNAMVSAYTFGASPATNFMNLRLLNGGLFRGTNVTFDSASIITIQLGGTNVAQFGRVAAGQTLTLAGTLTVTLAPGYMPVAGDTFDLLDWGALSGAFAVKNLPAGYAWVDRLSVDGTLRLSPRGTLILVR
jgi:hypothetical protein